MEGSQVLLDENNGIINEIDETEDIIRERTFCEKINGQSSNVKLCWIYAFLNGVGFGIWGISILSNFIFILANDSTEEVGYVEAVQGASQLLASPLCGYLADKYSHEKILRVSGFMDICLLAALSYFVWTSDQMLPFYCVLGAYGFFTSFEGAAFESILANSTATEDRTFVYAVRTAALYLGNTMGPLVNIILFYEVGNKWGLMELRHIFVVGLGICFIAGLFLFGFKDDATLGKESESRDGAALTAPRELTLAQKRIPVYNLGSLIVIMCGAGMSVKFFPIYFQDHLNMSPIFVQYIYVATQFSTGLCAILLESVAHHAGRVWTITIAFLIGIGCLISLVFVTNKYLVFLIFVLRSSLSNGCTPLQRSILMDYVPKKNRGKWSAMENLLGTFWTGSAAFGGWLIVKYGYDICFIVTASFYLVGSLIYLPVYKYVKD